MEKIPKKKIQKKIRKISTKNYVKKIRGKTAKNSVKKVPQTPTTQSRGCLLVSRFWSCSGSTVARTNPGFRVWGGSRRKDYSHRTFARLKIPQSGPILRANFSRCPNFSGQAPGNTHRLQEPVLSLVPPPD